jgi:hypothetical protein
MPVWVGWHGLLTYVQSHCYTQPVAGGLADHHGVTFPYQYADADRDPDDHACTQRYTAPADPHAQLKSHAHAYGVDHTYPVANADLRAGR